VRRIRSPILWPLAVVGHERAAPASLLAAASLLVLVAASAPAASDVRKTKTRVSATAELAVYTRADNDRKGLFALTVAGRSDGWIARPLAVETACPSPDGSAVAVTKTGDGVRIANRKSGVIRTLPFGAAWSCAGFSADGTVLLLVSPPLACLRSQPHLPRGECPDAARKLAVVPMRGAPSTLAFGPGHGFRSAVWAPRTHELALIRLARVGRFGADSAGSIEIARVNAGRITLRRLGGLRNADTLAWSPDGRMLAAEHSSSRTGGGVSTIAIVNLATGHAVDLGPGREPVWSRRRALAWVCGRAICVQGPAVATVRHIQAPAGWRPADATGAYRTPAWSPAGNELAFEAAPTRDSSRIMIWNATTNRVRMLFPAERNAEEAVPAWSPDGRYVAYWAGLFRDQAAIYAIKPGGSKAALLSPQGHGGYAFDDGFFWWP
jgi:WD40 repeat protein